MQFNSTDHVTSGRTSLLWQWHRSKVDVPRKGDGQDLDLDVPSNTDLYLCSTDLQNFSINKGDNSPEFYRSEINHEQRVKNVRTMPFDTYFHRKRRSKNVCLQSRGNN